MNSLTQAANLVAQQISPMTLHAGLPAVSMGQFLPAQNFLPAFHSLMATGQPLGMPMVSMASATNGTTVAAAAAVLEKVWFVLALTFYALLSYEFQDTFYLKDCKLFFVSLIGETCPGSLSHANVIPSFVIHGHVGYGKPSSVLWSGDE